MAVQATQQAVVVAVVAQRATHGPLRAVPEELAPKETVAPASEHGWVAAAVVVVVQSVRQIPTRVEQVSLPASPAPVWSTALEVKSTWPSQHLAQVARLEPTPILVKPEARTVSSSSATR